MNKTIKFLVEDINKKTRLDKFLVEKLTTFTRSQIKKIIISGGVRINKKKSNQHQKLLEKKAKLRFQLFKIKMSI